MSEVNQTKWISVVKNGYRQLDSLQEYEYAKTAVMAGFIQTTETIALKPVCENLGLNWKSAHQRLQRSEELNQLSVLGKGIGKDGKTYEMVCLPPEAFQEWLYFIESSESENFNKDLLKRYQKGLVIHLLLMLKVSLAEVERLRHLESLYYDQKAKIRAYLSLQQAASQARRDGVQRRKDQEELIESLHQLDLQSHQLKLEL